jgi:hypothetical protein
MQAKQQLLHLPLHTAGASARAKLRPHTVLSGRESHHQGALRCIVLWQYQCIQNRGSTATFDVRGRAQQPAKELQVTLSKTQSMNLHMYCHIPHCY